MFLPNDGEQDIQCKAPTDDTRNRLSQLINSIDCVYELDTNIYDIVIDEAAAYFAGVREIDEALAMIQSKAQLYLGEQYS